MIRKGPLIGGKGTYQLNKLEAALPHVSRKGVAVDIGAHVGLWTRVLARHFTTVHAFEMYEPHCDCLYVNCGDIGNVIIHDRIALGAGVGAAEVAAVLENSGNTRVRAIGEAPVACTAKMRPLDAYAPVIGDVDFIKIDVEGFEQQVVIGGTELIKRCKPTMVVEQKPGNAERYGYGTGEVLDLLKVWGARIVWSRNGDHCLTWR